MEEEKKEDSCCQGRKHHKCCGHKVIFLVLAGLIIFSLGVCFGLCQSYGHRGYGERSFSLEQPEGRPMMNHSFEEKQGGCQMKNSDAPKECGCQGQGQTANYVTPNAAVKNIVPATPIK